jgi:glutathione synthase/RimK-type ligase-like ATP-grasp enzyme
VIVAVSHARDEHAPPVLSALRRMGAEAVLLDLADFPLRGRIALDYGSRARGAPLRTPVGDLRPEEVRAVWWRRPEPFDLGRELSPADAAFSFRQVLEALAGLAASLDASWVNDPRRDAAASLKTRQLALAERLGLRVPATLVTNDPDRARAFLAKRGRAATVHKALHGIDADWRPTRLVGPEDRARLESLRWAPVVFQEYVPGVDVRVTVVGDRLFPAEIDARKTASPEDFRAVWREAPMAPCALPAAVERALRALVAELGLRFAAIDLRRRDDGEHVFLEVNPSGQWLFVEERTGLPITEAVARLLAGRRGRAPRTGGR